jgi:nucleoside-diphosphate kinase
MSNEYTIAMIKSGAMARGEKNAIVERIKKAGLVIRTIVCGVLTEKQAREFYLEHADRPYFGGLIESVTGSSGVCAMLLEGEHAIQRWRNLMGPTDPQQAPAGTIRADFGLLLPDNATHGSDSPGAVKREARILRTALCRDGRRQGANAGVLTAEEV